jgi:formate-dependent nitrite reductase membrane component NrfD
MIPLAAAEHFAGPPDWTWYILFYFFLAGLAGGSYVIATLLRHWGDPSDEPAARLGYTVAFPTILVCPILLALDLGKPVLFWHMLVNTTAGAGGVNFKAGSPMSVGSWALLVFSLFAAVSFLEVLVHDRVIRLPLAQRAVRLLDGTPGKVWNVVGAALGLFIAGYTGVLLAVSNQPVWSDTWTLGGLFLASGLSGSAALLALLVRYRTDARASAGMLTLSERLFALLELALVVAFALTLITPGTIGDAFGFPWILLWLVAFAGLVPGLGALATRRLALAGEGITGQASVAAAQSALAAAAVPGLILIGVLALRAAVIFSAQ